MKNPGCLEQFRGVTVFNLPGVPHNPLWLFGSSDASPAPAGGWDSLSGKWMPSGKILHVGLLSC